MGSHKQTNRCPEREKEQNNQKKREGGGKKLSNVSRLMNHPGISSKVLLHCRLKRTFSRNRFNVRRQIILIQGSLVKEWVFGVWANPWYVEVERTRSGCMWLNIWNFGKELVEIWWPRERKMLNMWLSLNCLDLFWVSRSLTDSNWSWPTWSLGPKCIMYRIILFWKICSFCWWYFDRPWNQEVQQ